jgi:hypothetical protein
VFHVLTLSKYSIMPASHVAYYSLYTLATLCALAWQRSSRPSYAAWRNWVQVRQLFLHPTCAAIRH